MKIHNLYHRRIVKIILLIVTIIIILLLLRYCAKKEGNTKIIINAEQSILQRMKNDEFYLFSLYDAPNICEKEWIINYRQLGKEFTHYKQEYQGDNIEIRSLLEKYVIYGKQIEEISISIDEAGYEKGIEQLEKLVEMAKEVEKELQRLYDKEFAN